jgi:hypothetical protein
MNKYNLECAATCDYEKARKILRQLYLQHHPDKGGDAQTFDQIYNCGKKLINERCKSNESDGCILSIQPQLRAGYTVLPKCIKTRSKNKFYDERCPIGSYYRNRYTVPPKCGPVAGTGLEGLERKRAQENYSKEFLEKAIQQQKFLLAFQLGWMFGVQRHRFVNNPDMDSIDKNIEERTFYLNNKYNYFDILKYETCIIHRKKQFKESDFKELIYADDNEIPGFLLGRQELFGLNNSIEWHGYYSFIRPISKQSKNKPCEGGEINRSPKTKLCLKPCKETQARNPLTNRCKKISK